MRIAATLVLACLVGVTGCAPMTVQELQGTGVHHQTASSQSAERAAGCIARNLEISWQGLMPSVRTAAQQGSWEIVVGGAAVGGGYVAYALAAPTATGSALSVWITDVRIQREEVARDALKGC